MKLLLCILTACCFLPVSAQNLLKNSHFDNGIDQWKFRILNKKKGAENLRAVFEPYSKPKAKSHKECAKIRVISTDKKKSYESISINQKILGLKKGKEYRFSAHVRSNIKRDDEVLVQIFSGAYTGSKTGYSQFYSGKKGFKGNGKWQEIEFVFKATPQKGGKGDLKNIGLRIGFGGRLGAYYIDSIKIERVK